MAATTVLIGATAVGFGVLLYEAVAENFDFDHLEKVRKIRKAYLKFGYPVTVVFVGLGVFVKLVHILI
ncbi:hypothetical protein RAH41_08280 [Gottfriedia acidiceleris]|uniref:hypothetical protein n=1 Tax=Gottfriedia acidiceleris TaxID=371036 RepID=UPI002F25F197